MLPQGEGYWASEYLGAGAGGIMTWRLPCQTHVSLAFLSLVSNLYALHGDPLREENYLKKKKVLRKHVVSKLHGLTVCPANKIMHRSLNLDIELHLLLKCICVF